jgi:hypothetical protein
VRLGLGLTAAFMAGVAALAAAPRQMPPATALPVERASNIFFARANINGRGPFWLTVDTGATQTVLDPSTARQLGLAVRDLGREAQIGVGSETTALATVTGVRIEIGTAPSFAPRMLYVLPTRAAEGPMGHRIDGILGTDFLRRFVVEIDYGRSRVLLHAAGAVPPMDAAVVPVRLEGNVLVAPGTLTLPDTERVTAGLLVDTGSSSGLSLNAPFVRRFRLEERFPSRELSVAIGVNGTTTRGVMRGATLSIGAGPPRDAPAALSHATEGLSASPDFDGILGADWLRQCHLVIDYPRRTLSVEVTGSAR